MEIHRVTDSFSVSPQIAPGDINVLREQGFVLIVNNRPDGEEPGQFSGDEIAAAAKAAGLAYRAIPVAGGFSDEQASAMAEALDTAEGPVFAFCRSGTRSTLVWSLAQALRGEDPAAITQAAAGAGYDVAPVRGAMERLAIS